MSQDDERIARKLLDLGSRSDRVQIRNGITYLDGYALGNGTVEIRSQVARDRRRRFIPEISGYAAAILYEVINGTNSEVWLQDDGNKPILITSLPRRLELGWSSSISSSTTNTLGYIMRQTLDSVILDPKTADDVINGGGGFFVDDSNLKFSSTNTASLAELGVQDTNEIGAPGITLFSFPSGDTTDNFAYYGSVSVNTLNIPSRFRHSNSSGSSSITLHDFSNQLSIFLQRRRGQTIIYLRNKPYHSLTTLAPDRATGDVWLESGYWVNGTLEIDETTPDPKDITGHLVEEPKKYLYDIVPDDPLLSGIGRRMFPGRNVYRLNSYEGYSLPFFLDQFLTDGEVAKGINFNHEYVAPDINGNPSFFTEGLTADFQGAPDGANQVLSVAIYPRG